MRAALGSCPCSKVCFVSVAPVCCPITILPLAPHTHLQKKTCRHSFIPLALTCRRLTRSLRARLDALPGDWQVWWSTWRALAWCPPCKQQVVLPMQGTSGGASNMALRLAVLPLSQVFLDTDGDLTFSPATEVSAATKECINGYPSGYQRC